MISAILLGIGLFMFLVLIHEYGHFRTARWFKVKVQEFGIGIPPKVLTLAKDKKGTAFTLNRIPLGGFVRLKGEDPSNEEEFLAADSFITAPLIGKLVILFAGIAANLLFAWIAFSIVFWQGVQPISILPDSATRTTSESYLMPSHSFLIKEGFLEPGALAQDTPILIEEVIPQSRMATLGLEANDHILTIDDQPVFQETIGQLLRTYIGRSFSLSYLHDNTIKTGSITCGQDECMLGIVMQELGKAPQMMPTIKFGLLQAMEAGRREIQAETKLTFHALGTLGKNLLSLDREKISGSVNKLSGPVGIVKMIETIFAQGGRRQLLAFGGVISLALALFNILPIPALDGGRALSVVIQAIGRWKPTTYFVIENRLNTVFFLLLMALGVWIILKDLVVFRGVRIPFVG